MVKRLGAAVRAIWRYTAGMCAGASTCFFSFGSSGRVGVSSGEPVEGGFFRLSAVVNPKN